MPEQLPNSHHREATLTGAGVHRSISRRHFISRMSWAGLGFTGLATACGDQLLTPGGGPSTLERGPEGSGVEPPPTANIDPWPASAPHRPVAGARIDRPYALPDALPELMDVRSHGALGNGLQDDTDAFNAGMRAAAARSIGLVVPPGEYMIDAVKSITLLSGVNVVMLPGAFLRVISNDKTHYTVFLGKGITEVCIMGGVLEGDRNRHHGTGGEWGHGVSLLGCSNITLHGVTVRDFWGDGIYIGPGAPAAQPARISRNIQVLGCVCENNRRQGISVTGLATGVFRDVICQGTKGTAPESGIDLEPNGTYVVSDLLIEHCSMLGNKGQGLQMCGTTERGYVVHRNVVRNVLCADNGAHGALLIRGVTSNTLESCVFERNYLCGALLVDRADGNSVLESWFEANSMQEIAFHEGVGIHGASSRNLIRGNLFATPEGVALRHVHGVRIADADSADNVLAYNYFNRAAVVSDIYDGGIGTVIIPTGLNIP